MKRNIYLLSTVAAMAFFTVSCSDDDNESNNNQNPVVELYTASNTSNRVSISDVSVLDGDVNSFSLGVGPVDCDGIYYDPASDQLIVASRSQNRLNLFGSIQNSIANQSSSLTFVNNSSNTDFTNPREIAVSGNNIFVVQDQAPENDMTNKIYVYQKNGDEFTRTKVYTIDFKLWGIHAEGNDLWAVVDNTGQIAKFENILSLESGAIFPTKKVTIEGLTRTHGITYSAHDNRMILTDIGDAASSTDGGIIVIDNFSSVFANTASGGTISVALQNIIRGSNTQLGNPTDVAYDHVTGRIYVAERLNGNGRVLTFSRPQSSTQNAAPIHSRLEPGVTSVYLSRR